MKIIDIDINSLKEYENNPRHNEAAIKKVAASIDEFGFKVPIVIDANNVIVCGHTRLKAAKMLGYEVVPCIVADDLNDEQIKAFRLADNKTSEFAEWDFEKLDEELAALAIAEFDMEQFGFEFDSDDEITVVEDEAPEVDDEAPPVTQLGDIWQLGRHRLLCGDSTDPVNIDLLMNGKKADLVFTDPPYGMKKENDGVLNDNLNFNDLLLFNKQWIPITFEALKENGSWYCWGIDEPLMDIYSEILKPLIKANKITFRNLITWDKGHGQGQLSADFRMFPIADEKCLFVMCGVQGFNNNADNFFDAWTPIVEYLDGQRKQMGWRIKDTKRIAGHSEKSGCHWFDKSQWTMPTEETYNAWKNEAQGKAFKREYDEIKREYYSTRAYFDNTHDNQNNVWRFERTSGEERELAGGHATPKPIALCSRAIKSSSRENEIVLDVFGGSGSTLIACEQLNRSAYVMELEPKWCDVIVKRWETLTGEKAVRL